MNNCNHKYRVHLCGGDNTGWAIDEDLRLTRESLDGFVKFTDIAEAEIVHACWWEPLIAIPEERLAEKKVICNMTGEPARYFALPQFIKAQERVDLWIAQSREAEEQLTSFGVPCAYVPYSVDIEIFRPLPKDDPYIAELRTKWSIPDNRYLIGTFHRDSEGHDLFAPKLVKGPDLFLEIARSLSREGLPIHVILAGPRRHWLRKKLEEHGVPFTFAGENTWDDDYHSNRLDAETINALYNLIDLYLVTSRSEGGPRSILEAAAAQCAIGSRRVGLACEVLTAEGCFNGIADSLKLIKSEISEGVLTKRTGHVGELVRNGYLPAFNRQRFEEAYKLLPEKGKSSSRTQCGSAPGKTRETLLRRLAAKMAGKNGMRSNRKVISLWHTFVEPPFGGGNQFMMALRRQLQIKGHTVVENKATSKITACVLNAVRFDTEKIRRLKRSRKNICIIHRIDGPISLIRGRDKELDDLCYALNAELASATIIQSKWTLQRAVEMGYRPVKFVVVLNGVDPDIFNKNGRIHFDRTRKVRLISSSWSDNVRKGGPIYKWLDEHLDWERYEYTFVGNSSESFQNIHRVEALPSRELADLLRSSDIYITASKNDPCSNAVIEALACGLPVIYLNDGGHPELVGLGGLPFDTPEDIPHQLETLIRHYESFQNLIQIPTMSDVADKYLETIGNA